VSEHAIELVVNGTARRATVEARRSLADLLREDFRLTGTHLGCEHGVCGACTVLLDREPARSCITLAVQASGSSVTTIEGVGAPNELHPVQDAFRDSHSQCGYCTPGFVMESLVLLRDNPAPSEREVREALAGKICRCTGYESIVRSVLLATERTREVE
jgi:aerobic carbon-monoxide dehydrogenase small subunit